MKLLMKLCSLLVAKVLWSYGVVVVVVVAVVVVVVAVHGIREGNPTIYDLVNCSIRFHCF
jgi:hypothetical protein